MPDIEWYVNGLDKLLGNSIGEMQDFTARYLRDMGTVMQAEDILSAIDTRKYSIDELTDMIAKKIRELNLTDPNRLGKLPIVCKDGITRYYDPDWWSQTIARTRAMTLNEEGLHNEMTRTGYDLVIVSIGGSGDECSRWEGKILSLTGKTPGFPTIEQARRSGEIFHPNCVHSSSPFIIAGPQEAQEIWGRDDLPSAAIEQLKTITKFQDLVAQMVEASLVRAAATRVMTLVSGETVQVGDAVLALRNSRWVTAQIVELESAERALVSKEGVSWLVSRYQIRR
jgi:hypothetical protein